SSKRSRVYFYVMMGVAVFKTANLTLARVIHLLTNLIGCRVCMALSNTQRYVPLFLKYSNG
ncbi:MAG: hypothetical protein LBH28_09585, partial [Oscillospiraceae bacterium]|nr:hypothetical protein [Oscillospiraceae bacterium]